MQFHLGELLKEILAGWLERIQIDPVLHMVD